MIFKSIFIYPRYPDNLSKLYLLAYNLWCTWDYEAINLFYRIDANLFRSVKHNPVKFLLSLPEETIREISNDKGFLLELDKVWQKFEEYMNYNRTSKSEDITDCGLSRSNTVAYFSMEFGLHESMPIYGGGLGILSGDFLKTASDLGLPVIGVGLIYKFGYFTQRINLEGRQEELFVEFENHLLPIREIHRPDGENAYVEMRMLGERCRIKLWQIDVGRTKLILLDTNIEDNPQRFRDITNELYVADREKRIQQEMVLGFGGVKALELLDIKPNIYHINEGHSAFLIIARLQKLMAEEKLSFSEARALVRASTVFTTHTPVIAGNENFETKLAKRYLEPEIRPLGLSFDEFGAYGFIENDKDIFWLPALAIRFSRYVNGVSKIHRDVSRKMWVGLFPATPAMEIPIDYVTNGVHWSWISEPFTNLFNRHIGPDYIHCRADGHLWDKLANAPDEEIWEAHHNNKHNLIDFIRRKLADDLAARGYSLPKIANLTRLFNPEYLTIVFARRFAHYKRATLILKDKERLAKILTNSKKPVQLIFAGKAHPADAAGKYMIKEILDFARDRWLEDRVIFLENYDIDVARHLLWGADVWLNTPVMENEASGTSGMKAAMNGVLNLSVPDGWWAEGFNAKNGWAITAGRFYTHSEPQEAAEAGQIYDFLEEEIAELFYDRNEAGIPKRWVAMMKESIISVCGNFNMNRVLMGYSKKFYTPAAKASDALRENNSQQLKDAMLQEQEVLKYWNIIGITDLTTNLDKKDHIVEGDTLDVQCTVNLDRAPAELLAVELFYMFDNKQNFKVVPMTLKSRQGNLAYYECSLGIEGHGLHNIDVRIRPADVTVQDLHPEMVKWKD
jgi:glycogen phosphorylase